MQRALDNILQSYLRQELRFENSTEDEEHERDDESLAVNLQNCLQNNGILKEVQLFFRQRLISVFEGKWPHLFEHFKIDSKLDPNVIHLVEDFLAAHKLLFTQSVLYSELGDSFTPHKPPSEKMSHDAATALLSKLRINEPNEIANAYVHAKNESLLDCIVKTHKFNMDTFKFKRNENNSTERLDERFRKLAAAMEREKQEAFENFKRDESARMRDELETENKYKLLKKEKELLESYDEKISHMKKSFEREKELWQSERAQKEREIEERREELLIAIQSVKDEEERLGNSLSYESDENKDIVAKGAKLLPGHKEMQRNLLLKEAQLKNSIQKLQKEKHMFKRLESENSENFQEINKKSISNRNIIASLLTGESKKRAELLKLLKSKRKFNKNNKESSSNESSENEKKRELKNVYANDTDTIDQIAFLKYQLEYQSQELEELKNLKQIRSPDNFNKKYTNGLVRQDYNEGHTNIYRIPNELRTESLEDFIKETKKRVADIEIEAIEVENSLEKINERRTSTQFNKPRHQIHNYQYESRIPPPPTIPESIFTHMSNVPHIQNVTVPKYLERKEVVTFDLPLLEKEETNKKETLREKNSSLKLRKTEPIKDDTKLKLNASSTPKLSSDYISVHEFFEHLRFNNSLSASSISSINSQKKQKDNKCNNFKRTPNQSRRSSLVSRDNSSKKHVMDENLSNSQSGSSKSRLNHSKSHSGDSIKERAKKSGALMLTKSKIKDEEALNKSLKNIEDFEKVEVTGNALNEKNVKSENNSMNSSSRLSKNSSRLLSEENKQGTSHDLSFNDEFFNA